jgi:hypothetical protein
LKVAVCILNKLQTRMMALQIVGIGGGRWGIMPWGKEYLAERDLRKRHPWHLCSVAS